MRVGLDLDGTFYDSLSSFYETSMKVLNLLGYAPVPLEKYRRVFQSNDWRKFNSDLGIRDDGIDEAMKLFQIEYLKVTPSHLIPGAKRALDKVEDSVGSENIFFITHESSERVRMRFERDGLSHLLENVHSPREGKSKEIYELAIEKSEIPFVYVGDLVSDGKACLEARKNGARNVKFYGITHPHAINHPDLIREFVQENCDFAETLDSLDDIDIIWAS